MTQDSFRDFVLEQLSTLDGRLYFKTNPDTLPDFLTFNAAVFTPSRKRFLQNYREVPIDILEDTYTLTT